MTSGMQESGMGVTKGLPMEALMRCAAIFAFCFFLHACGSAAIDGTAPSATATMSGPRDTATFPNLNIPPTPAAEQISDSQKADTTSALTEARKRATSQNTTVPRNQAADLRRLARSHGDDALKLIEAEQ